MLLTSKTCFGSITINPRLNTSLILVKLGAYSTGLACPGSHPSRLASVRGAGVKQPAAIAVTPGLDQVDGLRHPLARSDACAVQILEPSQHIGVPPGWERKAGSLLKGTVDGLEIDGHEYRQSSATTFISQRMRPRPVPAASEPAVAISNPPVAPALWKSPRTCWRISSGEPLRSKKGGI